MTATLSESPPNMCLKLTAPVLGGRIAFVHRTAWRRSLRAFRQALGTVLFAFGWNMKTPLSLVVLLTSILAPSIAPGQVATSRHWVRLLTTEGETVDLDTTAVGRRDGSFVVWLRWDFDRHGPEFRPEYRVEQVEVDCRGLRQRVLTAVDSRKPLLLPGDSTKSSSVPLDSTDTTWRAYSKGSLGAQSTSALCRRLTSA